MYPSLEQVLSKPHQLLDGSSIVARYTHQGENIIYKESSEQFLNRISSHKKSPLFLLKKLDQFILHSINRQKPIERFKQLGEKNSTENIAYTLKRWKELHIPTAEIIAIKDTSIILHDVGEDNLQIDLSVKNYQKEVFTSLVHTVHNIRTATREHNDIRLVHNDAWPKNFVYNKDTHLTHAIDPGEQLLQELNPQQSVSIMDLTLLYGLRQLNSPHASTYTKNYASTLEKKEKLDVVKINSYLHSAFSTYLQIRQELVRIIKNKPKTNHANFSKENMIEINDYLLSS